MRVTIIGCSDSFGSGGRYNTATLVEARSGSPFAQTCLLDCGATTMTALNEMAIDPNRIDFIALTHLHGDHFGGIPFLLLDAQWIRKRTRPLRIIGPPGTSQRVDDALKVLFEASLQDIAWNFDLQIAELEPGSSQSCAGFTMRTVQVQHGHGVPATAVRLEANGKILVHSGDTEWTQVLPQIAAGADLFLVECFSVGQTPLHLDYNRLAAQRGDFDAKRVVLTHMGPAMLDFRGRVDRTAFDLAEDGKVYEL